MLADASAKLIDLLRIRTQPIGMRLFEDPADMEKIQGVRKPTEGFKFTMCQMVTQSRWYGFTLGITVDNTRGGNCGGVVGLNHPGEGFLSGDHMNGVWFGNKEASAAHQAQMPRVPDGKYNGLVVSPLALGAARSARHLPVLRHARPDDLFHQRPAVPSLPPLRLHLHGRERLRRIRGARALATRQTSLSLPCYAERRYGGVADDELLMACPPDEFLRAIEGMGHLGKNGLRYPFPPYGAAMDPAFGMAKSYS